MYLDSSRWNSSEQAKVGKKLSRSDLQDVVFYVTLYQGGLFHATEFYFKDNQSNRTATETCPKIVTGIK